jgi:hypothetical protein
MGIKPMFNSTSKGPYPHKACALGFHHTLTTILMKKLVKGFEWFVAIGEIKISSSALCRNRTLS